jgi:hypothetical protein
MQEAHDKQQGEMLDIPAGLGEAISPALAGIPRIHPDLLKAIPESFNLPAGVMEPGSPLAEGGTVPKAATSLIEGAADRTAAAKQGDLNRKNQRDVAGIYAAARRNGAAGGITDDDISALADGVESGEITSPQTAQALVGGVKSGAGVKIWRELARRGSRVVDPKTRESLGQIQSARAIVDTLEELVGNVASAKDPTERAKATLLLESTGQATAAMLSKGFGESGRLAEGDIQRARALVPGWKAANFDPNFAQREIDLIRKSMDKAEASVVAGRNKTYKKPGAPAAPGGGAPGGFDPSQSYGATVGQSMKGPDGKVLTWNGRQWQ